jgi:hypothetical protein
MNSAQRDQIRYRAIRQYKYQLVENYSVDTGLRRDKGARIPGDYVILEPGGRLHIKQGYAWDGPSGPTIDTKNFLRGSLVHDALYQLIRETALGESERAHADRLLRQHCLEDGMSAARAWYVWKAVQWFGKSSAAAEPPPVIETAPE